ncbi:4-hydroxy-tetrahydrodipicolinate synthase [Rhodococcus triatomae]|uniref:4-hydroxy-tetrahydrodipicolinate synthase n=1 Tax=Rhodococcus triatomae TaxID=300028 RepID=A0A1G8CV53_9NOCA|nr:4-hydroxy-tetrahydrodipicolinate synthase [Rhodococcus triatomae]QNG18573.1 4-hydroxy-tetrahydrodipicolinate synthase [Rhodococcus triatomae]QNG21758.1 4-hydroxy-tetrahydrodipicolinate synthase [Rhodococcus triatomae]SDH49348.1 4-hydroxy-tetrahydrodipicolinate synthase [Rhodococcus triatomae]
MAFDPAAFRPSGIFVPLVTPFAEGGDVAASDLEHLAHTVIDEGAAGIVALGTTAETATLSARERRDVLRICGGVCHERRVPLVVGAGSPDTVGTVRALDDLARDVDEESAVAAALVVVPYYTRPTEAGVVAHFEYVADRSPLPVIVYNVPYRTGQHLGWESIVRLAEHPRIVGIKQAVGSLDADTVQLLASHPTPHASFSILAGDDVLVPPLLAMGAAGAIAAAANVCAPEFVELLGHWRRGDLTRARALGNELAAPTAALMSHPNPTAIKAVLFAQQRISAPDVRLPLLAARDPEKVVATITRLRSRDQRAESSRYTPTG